MDYLDLTLNVPAADVALDDALLENAEAGASPCEVVRLWEPEQATVVIGRSSRIDSEVDRDRCRKLGVPVLRRASGGAAIVTGAGCLMYAVLLSLERRPYLQAIHTAHRFVLEALASALSRHADGIAAAGTSDLAIGNRKFSGNSVRCRRRHLLYHGTLLYDFDLSAIGRLLKLPPRQPEYRAGRDHEQFVANLPVDRQTLRDSVLSAFGAKRQITDWPTETVDRLVAEKYGSESWNARR